MVWQGVRRTQKAFLLFFVFLVSFLMSLWDFVVWRLGDRQTPIRIIIKLVMKYP